MNVELLRKIAAVIQEKPAEFGMNEWHSACGTAHCIGGWAQILSGKEVDSGMAFSDGMRALGISQYQAYNLFFTEDWPGKFDHRSPTSAAARIEHFIATGGRE